MELKSGISLILLKSGETIMGRVGDICEGDTNITIRKPIRISLVQTNQGIRPQVSDFPLMFPEFYLTRPRESYTLDLSEIFIIYIESEIKVELIKMYTEKTSSITIVETIPSIIK